MYNVSDIRNRGKEIFDLADRQTVILKRHGKQYVLMAYTEEKTLGSLGARVNEHEEFIQRLKAKIVNSTDWSA